MTDRHCHRHRLLHRHHHFHLTSSLPSPPQRQLKQSGAWLDARRRRALNWHLANLEFANAANLSALSAEHWDQDDVNEYAGDHAVLPDGGYGALLHKLAAGIEVRYHSPVVAIESRDDGSAGSAGELIRVVTMDEVHLGRVSSTKSGGCSPLPPLSPRPSRCRCTRRRPSSSPCRSACSSAPPTRAASGSSRRCRPPTCRRSRASGSGC